MYRDLVAELFVIFNVNHVAHLHRHVQLFDNLMVQKFVSLPSHWSFVDSATVFSSLGKDGLLARV